MLLGNPNLHLRLLDVLYFDEYKILRSHVHQRSYCALSLRIQSDTEIELADRSIPLHGQSLAFFPPCLPYTRHSQRDQMIVIHLDIQNTVGYELEVLPLDDEAFSRLRPLFEQILTEWQEKRTGYAYRAASLLHLIFGEICTLLQSDARPINQSIQSALDTIERSYADSQLSVEQLAHDAHMSDTYFRRLFKRETGVSPKRYINDLRMERAQALLNAGYDTVAATAEKVGFRDAKNFATAFKKHFGYPPSEQSYSW